MSDGSVVSLTSVRPKPATASGWSPRELLHSLFSEEMPNGVVVAWMDENRNVQVRRAQITPGQELDVFNTARRILLTQQSSE